MSAGYRAITWTRDKKVYDLVLAAAVLLYLGVFLGVGFATHPNATAETQLIRALGTAAFLLLHVVLSIGPLARLDRRFLPLLANRRHLGVATFLLAAGHGVISLVQFHALGERNPLVSVLVSHGGWDGVSRFPFQPLGLAAFLILFLLAVTSHDFWLANLTAPVWKTLHMLVYLAYGLLVAHVALGALQDERHPALAATLVAGVGWVCGLHVVAGLRDPVRRHLLRATDPSGGFVEVCRVDDIPLERARIVELSGERVAVFRYSDDGGQRIAAVSNVCQHQNGPLGEGKVIDGCITCPWHGYQYRPEDGASPPPFTEKVPTFRVRVDGDRVSIDPRPLAAGTPTVPARIPGIPLETG